MSPPGPASLTLASPIASASVAMADGRKLHVRRPVSSMPGRQPSPLPHTEVAAPRRRFGGALQVPGRPRRRGCIGRRVVRAHGEVRYGVKRLRRQEALREGRGGAASSRNNLPSGPCGPGAAGPTATDCALSEACANVASRC